MKTPFRCLSENRRNTLVYLVRLTPLALLDIETQNTGVNFGLHLPYLEYGENFFFSIRRVMYRLNRRFNMPPPPGQPRGHLTFLKIFVPIPPYSGQNAVQMPHTRVHSGDQMPPPRGHFTERRRKLLQLSNKIFINITKTEKHG